MTKVTFLDNNTINVIARDGETITLKTYFPILENEQQGIAHLLATYFEDNFEDDKTSMIYWVLMKMMGNHSFSFYYEGSNYDEERKRIGARIRQLRESRGFDANKLATLANIDAANLCRIEQGRYSVGVNILSKIATALGVKVDLI